MSTNATINVKMEDGKYQQTYLHWDGADAGKRLVENFNTQELAEELSNLGDLSCLGTHAGTKHDFNKHDDESTREMCCAYGRDRGESDTAPTVFDSFMDLARDGQEQEYNYFFIDGAWFVCRSVHNIHKDALAPLTAKEVNV